MKLASGPVLAIHVPAGTSVGDLKSDGHDGVWYVVYPTDQVCHWSGVGDPLCIDTGARDPRMLTVGPDGTVWLTFSNVAQLGSVGSSGKLITQAIPSGRIAWGVAAAADGRAWFTESHLCSGTTCNGAIGVATSAGVVEFNTPDRLPGWIAYGGNGRMWVGDSRGLGLVSGSGETAWFPTDGALVGFDWLTLGADGNIWFERDGQQPPSVGVTTPGGQNRLFDFPDRSRHLGSVAMGPDGNIWLDTSVPGKLGKVTMDGAISEVSLPWPDARGAVIASSREGLWLTDGRTVWWLRLIP